MLFNPVINGSRVRETGNVIFNADVSDDDGSVRCWGCGAFGQRG
ncbi:hypothetical protein OV208_06610 [Corallococcus sp. bb12-1]|nr:hypothetical protein [Corallococcus sp. bb12-1]MCY1040983.1 hypothetical protein [Corallococcus sp. bb12-1]